MYIFFGIFILICIFFAVFFHRRRKRIIQKIRNMSPCAQKKLLDELMQPFGFLSCPQQNISHPILIRGSAPLAIHVFLTTQHHILKWYLTANRFILTMITEHG